MSVGNDPIVMNFISKLSRELYDYYQYNRNFAFLIICRCMPIRSHDQNNYTFSEYGSY